MGFWNYNQEIVMITTPAS